MAGCAAASTSSRRARSARRRCSPDAPRSSAASPAASPARGARSRSCRPSSRARCSSAACDPFPRSRRTSSILADMKSVVQPMLLSHGTLMSKDLAKSRRFYEEFLGLEVVRHARPAMMLRFKSGMYVVCVCIGEKVPNQHVLTHWGINVSSREEVDHAYAEAQRLKDE